MVWGEGISSAGEERNKFLSSESTPMTERAGRQSTIKLLSGVEWLSRMILRGVVDDAVEVASSLAVTEGWEEWWGEESSQQRSSQRSRKEEKWLWRVLDELDREEARESSKKQKLKIKKIQRARTKMKVGKDQPSIKEKLSVAQLSGMRSGVCMAEELVHERGDELVPSTKSSMSVTQPSGDVHGVDGMKRVCDDGLAPGPVCNMSVAQLSEDIH